MLLDAWSDSVTLTTPLLSPAKELSGTTDNSIAIINKHATPFFVMLFQHSFMDSSILPYTYSVIDVTIFCSTTKDTPVAALSFRLMRVPPNFPGLCETYSPVLVPRVQRMPL